MAVDEMLRVFRRSKNPALLVGAGLSRSHPTGVPLFRELRQEYMTALDPDWKMLQAHSRLDFYPMREAILELDIESFFSDLQFFFGYEILRVIDQWVNARPLNRGHLSIARLSTLLNLKTILTTNFDLLLERDLPNFQSIGEMKVLTAFSHRGSSKKPPFMG